MFSVELAFAHATPGRPRPGRPAGGLPPPELVAAELIVVVAELIELKLVAEVVKLVEVGGVVAEAKSRSGQTIATMPTPSTRHEYKVGLVREPPLSLAGSLCFCDCQKPKSVTNGARIDEASIRDLIAATFVALAQLTTGS